MYFSIRKSLILILVLINSDDKKTHYETTRDIYIYSRLEEYLPSIKNNTSLYPVELTHVCLFHSVGNMVP